MAVVSIKKRKSSQYFRVCLVGVCLVEEPTVTEWNGSIPEERVGSIPVFGRCKIVEWVGSIPVFGSEEWNEKWNNRNSKFGSISFEFSRKTT